MERNALINWIESHNVPELLRVYVHNMKANRNYEALTGLVGDSVATIELKLVRNGLIVNGVESREGDVTELEQKVKTLEETVEEQTKEIAGLKEEAKKKPTEEITTNENVGSDIVQGHIDFVKSEKEEAKVKGKRKP